MTFDFHRCYFPNMFPPPSATDTPADGPPVHGTAYLQVPDGSAPRGAEQLSPAEEALHNAGQLPKLGGSSLTTPALTPLPLLSALCRFEPRRAGSGRVRNRAGPRMSARMSAATARSTTSSFVSGACHTH